MTAASSRLKWIAWATVALYVLIAVCLTHMPKPPTELTAHFWDKSLHCVGYAMYAATIYVAAGLTWPRFRWLVLSLVVALAAWAAMDEITQPLFHRDCDLFDWIADMTGAISAVVLLSGLRFVATRVGRRTLELRAQ